MPPTTYDKPSDAFSALPQGALVRVRPAERGKGIDIKRPDGGLDWDKATFDSALLEGVLPRAKYVLRPVVGGKVSHKRVSLDLSFSEESVTVEGAGGPEVMQGTFQQGYAQEKMIEATLDVLRDERGEKWDLYDENKELREENATLKMENLSLKHRLEDAGRDDSLSRMLSRTAETAMAGPAGAVLFGKLLGANMGELLAEAAKGAVKVG